MTRRRIILGSLTLAAGVVAFLASVSLFSRPRGAAPRDVVSPTEDEPYFPPRAFAGANSWNSDEEWSNFVGMQYSPMLRAMKESSLWVRSRRDPSATAYRFLWITASGSQPIAVRIEKSAHGANLSLRRLDGSFGDHAGTLASTREVALDDEQWRRVTHLVRRSGFWRMPEYVSGMGADGEELVLEGVDGGEYHAVTRWCPGSGAYRELCQTMLQLAGVDLARVRWTMTPEGLWTPWEIAATAALAVMSLVLMPAYLRRRRKRRQGDEDRR